MGRTSLQDVLSLQDPAVSWNFDLFLPAIPGSSDTRNLTFKCMTTDLPGATIEAVGVSLHGVELQFAGRKTYTHTLNATFLETADYDTREKFRRWQESMRSWKNNTGTLAAQYKVTGQVVVYNDIPAVMKTVNVIGMWPETMAEVPLDGSQSSLITLQIGFKFDLWDDQ